VATNIAGQPEATTYTDINAPSSGPCIYRVRPMPLADKVPYGESRVTAR